MASALMSNTPAGNVDSMLRTIMERRRDPRYCVREWARLYVSRRPQHAVICDISMSGVRLGTRMPREADSFAGLELTVLDRRFTLPLRLHWERWTGDCFESGGSFVDLTEMEEAFLAAYIDQFARRPDRETRRPAPAAMLSQGVPPVHSRRFGTTRNQPPGHEDAKNLSGSHT